MKLFFPNLLQKAFKFLCVTMITPLLLTSCGKGKSIQAIPVEEVEDTYPKEIDLMKLFLNDKRMYVQSTIPNDVSDDFMELREDGSMCITSPQANAPVTGTT